MPENNFEQEILDYIGELTVLINIKDQEKVDLKKIHTIIVTIMGISKVYNYPKIEELLHGLLKVLDGLHGGRFSFSAKHKQVLLVTCEYIKKILGTNNKESNNFSIKHIMETYSGIASEEPTDINKSYVNDIIKTQSKISINSGEIKLDSSKEVSVTLNKIDSMIKNINELILNQYQLKTTIEKIEQIEIEPKHQRTYNEINNSIKSQILKIELGSNNLQDEILALRMLPISIIHNDILEGVNKTIKESGKDIKVNLPNKVIIIDKLILQNIQSPIINIINNSIIHGIETTGEINIEYIEESGKITVEISDNGCGIDFEKIRKRSIEIFPHDKEGILELTENELLRFAFMEGVSSSKKFQGMGLSNAEDCIKNIKGSINVFSDRGSGVMVKITVPKSLTTITGYFIVSGGEKFFIPSAYINEIITVQKENILDLVTRQAVKLRDEIVPIYPLSGILDDKTSKPANKLFIIICKINNESIGIVIDEILYHSSAIYKRLPNNIEGLSSIQGVVFDEEFNIVNILYIPKITDQLKCIRNIEFNTRYAKDSVDYKKILIIDDSSINRSIVQNMFSRSGFSVEMANDGIDALQKIKEDYFHLIITDSDMPRMDGATFIENLKKEKGYGDTPIIVLSSSKTHKEIDKFMDIGAKAVYLKSNFNRDKLLKNVKELLGSINE
ncbi:MAG: response regulator [Spirochaetales bacterium]|nr:response regulator [Spirochaetales bacterium]